MLSKYCSELGNDAAFLLFSVQITVGKASWHLLCWLFFLAETKKKHKLGNSFTDGCSKHAYSSVSVFLLFIRYTLSEVEK